MNKILLVDDEKSMRDFLGIVLKKEGYYVSTASNGDEAIRAIQKEIYDLVITDIKMPKCGGLEVLKAVKESCPQAAVLMITAFASTETAVEAMKEGAYDYITKPFQIDEVKLIIRNAIEKKSLREENTRLRRELKEQSSFDRIVGRSEQMQKVLDLVQKVADSNSNVLIFGESGTGKELIARAIHFNSRRKEKPFVTVNCSALPETLLESELFGHMRGSFTGAVSNKEGLFEVAHEGTLFLDEIGETSLAIQVKLLRVLQEREFRRIGGTKDIKVDVRIIAATNKDLERAVAEGTFREDLYYRLDVIPIYLPQLRVRPEDIDLLAEHFLQKFSRRVGKSIRGISPDAVSLLRVQEWKGNVRELENVMERAVALATTDTITPGHLQECLQKPSPSRDSVMMEIPDKGIDLENMIGNLEKDFLLKALQKTNGVKKEAAKLLGLNFRSFRYRLDKYGISREGSADSSDAA